MSQPARVLIVDDDPTNRDVLEQELELIGCTALSAAGGRAALELLNRQEVDLILLDVMMPDLNGYAVLREIKGNPTLRHLSIIMISARDDLDSIVRCIEMGADDYLPKPFEPLLLRARVGSCLERKRWRDQETLYLKQIKMQLSEIEHQRRRADQLLHIIMPASAVEELKATGRISPRRHDGVAVLFADIVGFTAYCESHPPEIVIANLDRLITDCEDLIASHGLEKIKTIGDGIVATANLLQGHRQPVEACIGCAQAITAAAHRNSARWDMRIGIHIGTVVAGMVGRSKFSFDLWGDTVNVAARLSGLGAGGGIYLSEDARRALGNGFRGQALGPVYLKGKGEVLAFRSEDRTDQPLAQKKQ